MKNLLQTEKMRKMLNKKILLGVFSIITCLGLITVCSFVPFVIDPKQWQTSEFLADELIIVAIVIMSMVSVMFIGQASNAQNELSRIAKARVKFFESIKTVVDKGINAFRQWIKKVLQPEDIQTIKERTIRSLGIDDLKILELDESQLKDLYEHGAGKYTLGGSEETRYFKSITEKQYEGILKIKKNKFKVTFVEPEYYLSVKNLTDNRTISERAANEGKKKGAFLFFAVLGRLMLTVITAMIFASLVRDLNSDLDAASAWAKFLSRVWALVSSSFMGYLVGTQMNDIDAEYIEMRIQVHTRYLQDSDFKPISQQDEAKEAYKDRIRKEQVLELDNKSNQIEMKEN